jgi:hypothetical protein
MFSPQNIHANLSYDHFLFDYINEGQATHTFAPCLFCTNLVALIKGLLTVII